MNTLPKVQFYIRRKGETLAQMIEEHKHPYGNYQEAENDAVDFVEAEDLKEDEIEIVKVSLETWTIPISVLKKP